MPNKPFSQTVFPLFSVKSIEESYRFYTNVLGFMPGNVMPGPDGKWGHAEVTLGNVTLMFGRLDQATMDPTYAKTTYVENIKKGAVGGGVNMYINVGFASIDQYYAAVRERGAKPIKEPETKFWGDRVFSVQDPDGYMLTFAETVADFDPSKIPSK
jgi:PhnB protein